MKLVLCWFVCWFMNYNVKADQNTQMRFAIDETLPDNRLIKDYRLGNVAVRTPQHCAVECQQNTRCVMFASSTNIEFCTLYYDHVGTTSNSHTVGQVKLVYYRAWCSDLPDYYYYRSIDTCLRRQRDNKNFEDADEDCAATGGALFEPRQADQVNFFNIYGTTRFWVGGFAMMGTWFWISGDEITAVTGSAYWLPSEPQNNTLDECMEMQAGTNGQYGYSHRSCQTLREFFCEIPDASILISIGSL